MATRRGMGGSAGWRWLPALLCALLGCACAGAQVEVDRVVAVVNNQVILASDVELERRMFLLLPVQEPGGETAAQALERLTTRALIEQQIVREDPKGMDVAAAQVDASLTELKQNLPGCRQQECMSAEGWAAHLAAMDLTAEEVRGYWANRMAVLRFIEMRFRSGIRIAPEEIEKYYREKLTPQYAKVADVPPLERVSARIEEVLLQEQVNALLNDWLKTLQDEGQVEVLDPALRGAVQVGGTANGERGGGR